MGQSEIEMIKQEPSLLILGAFGGYEMHSRCLLDRKDQLCYIFHGRKFKFQKFSSGFNSQICSDLIVWGPRNYLIKCRFKNITGIQILYCSVSYPFIIAFCVINDVGPARRPESLDVGSFPFDCELMILWSDIPAQGRRFIWTEKNINIGL